MPETPGCGRWWWASDGEALIRAVPFTVDPSDACRISCCSRTARLISSTSFAGLISSCFGFAVTDCKMIGSSPARCVGRYSNQSNHARAVLAWWLAVAYKPKYTPVNPPAISVLKVTGFRAAHRDRRLRSSRVNRPHSTPDCTSRVPLRPRNHAPSATVRDATFDRDRADAPPHDHRPLAAALRDEKIAPVRFVHQHGQPRFFMLIRRDEFEAGRGAATEVLLPPPDKRERSNIVQRRGQAAQAQPARPLVQTPRALDGLRRKFQ